MELMNTYYNFDPLPEDVRCIIMAYTGYIQFIPQSFYTFISLKTGGMLSELDLYTQAGRNLLKNCVAADFKRLAGVEPSLDDVVGNLSNFTYVIEPLPKEQRYVISAYTGHSMIREEEKEDYRKFLCKIEEDYRKFLCKIAGRKYCEDYTGVAYCEDYTGVALIRSIAEARLKNDYLRLFVTQTVLDDMFDKQESVYNQLSVFSDKKPIKAMTAKQMLKNVRKSQKKK